MKDTGCAMLFSNGNAAYFNDKDEQMPDRNG